MTQIMTLYQVHSLDFFTYQNWKAIRRHTLKNQRMLNLTETLKQKVISTKGKSVSFLTDFGYVTVGIVFKGWWCESFKHWVRVFNTLLSSKVDPNQDNDKRVLMKN